MTKLVIFLVLSSGVVFLSWPSLRNPGMHGFYRFFAMETLLVLILANVDRWFVDPLSAVQIVSWCLLCSSIVLAIQGFYFLRIVGQPRGNFENTTQLVIVGMYKYIRHPLYGSLLFLTWGAFLKDCTLLAILLTLITSVFLYATARVEETENIGRFGPRYEEYMKSTKMFVPFAF